MLVNFYQTTLYHILECSNFHTQCHDNIKFHKMRASSTCNITEMLFKWFYQLGHLRCCGIGKQLVKGSPVNPTGQLHIGV